MFDNELIKVTHTLPNCEQSKLVICMINKDAYVDKETSCYIKTIPFGSYSYVLTSYEE
jgi:hypothetical protein